MRRDQGEFLLSLLEHQAQDGASGDQAAAGSRSSTHGHDRCIAVHYLDICGVTPSASATIWAKIVAVPWPCGESPVWTVIWPDGSMMTRVIRQGATRPPELDNRGQADANARCSRSPG